MALAVIDLVRIVVLSSIGSLISYHDLKEKKIYNKYILVLLVIGFSLFLLTFSFKFLPSFFVNFFLSVLLGFFFWKLGYWGAGDAKLFSATSLYLPHLSYSGFFPSAQVLTNTFILAFLIWFLPTLLKTKKKEKIEAIKITFNPRNIINIVLMGFGLFYFLGILFQSINLGIYTIYILTFIFMLFTFFISQKFLQKKIVYLLSALFLMRFIFDPQSFLSLSFWITSSIMILVILLFVWIGNLSFYISYEERYLKDLKKGDIPIGIASKENKKLDLTNFLEKYFGNKEILARGFNEKEIKKAKGIKLIDAFLVKKYISFTPLLIISTLLVAFLENDIIMFIYALFFK